jgi:hypothetical protein
VKDKSTGNPIVSTRVSKDVIDKLEQIRAENPYAKIADLVRTAVLIFVNMPKAERVRQQKEYAED